MSIEPTSVKGLIRQGFLRSHGSPRKHFLTAKPVFQGIK
jgi:hypothetical protein